MTAASSDAGPDEALHVFTGSSEVKGRVFPREMVVGSHGAVPPQGQAQLHPQLVESLGRALSRAARLQSADPRPVRNKCLLLWVLVRRWKLTDTEV